VGLPAARPPGVRGGPIRLSGVGGPRAGPPSRQRGTGRDRLRDGCQRLFHLRPSAATALGIPAELLRVWVRSNRDLSVDDVDRDVVRSWFADDRPVLLLDLAGAAALRRTVEAYLESAGGRDARRAYKCSNRRPWFAVPDVRTPHAFLSVMSGRGPRLVANSAGATCTNSVHAVEFLNGATPCATSGPGATS